MEEGEEGEAEWDRLLARRDSQAEVHPVSAEGQPEQEHPLARLGPQERAPPVPAEGQAEHQVPAEQERRLAQ